jgi:hypothetical protein
MKGMKTEDRREGKARARQNRAAARAAGAARGAGATRTMRMMRALRSKAAAVCLLVALCALAAVGCAGGAGSAKAGKDLGQVAQQDGAASAAVPDDSGGSVEQGLPGAAAGEEAGAAGAGEPSGAGADAGAPPSAAGVTHQLVDVDNSGDVIEIKEKMFIAQTNDIYLNIDDYLGKSVRYEGYFAQYQDAETYETFNFVVRNGPGCCGYDSSVGFEVDWKGDLPTVDDWCSVQGVVDIYKENGLDYIVVRADSLDVLPYRGKDTVVQ